MSNAPVTLEGWFTLHEMWAVDWPRWNALAAADREAVTAEAAALIEAQQSPGEGHSSCWSLLTQKGDLCVMHWRRDLEGLRAAETAFARTRLRAYLVPTYSYLAVVELGTYELAAQAGAMLERKGVTRDGSEWEVALRAEMERLARPRLYPETPGKRYCCFYPMSKRRGEQVNWYDLPPADRAAMMRGHGEIGRKYAGQVIQVIQGSVGLDDWEWGVTLFADDPLVFKKLIYEMRFDPASSRYALFGAVLRRHPLRARAARRGPARWRPGLAAPAAQRSADHVEQADPREGELHRGSPARHRGPGCLRAVEEDANQEEVLDAVAGAGQPLSPGERSAERGEGRRDASEARRAPEAAQRQGRRVEHHEQVVEAEAHAGRAPRTHVPRVDHCLRRGHVARELEGPDAEGDRRRLQLLVEDTHRDGHDQGRQDEPAEHRAAAHERDRLEGMAHDAPISGERGERLLEPLDGAGEPMRLDESCEAPRVGGARRQAEVDRREREIGDRRDDAPSGGEVGLGASELPRHRGCEVAGGERVGERSIRRDQGGGRLLADPGDAGQSVGRDHRGGSRSRRRHGRESRTAW